MTTMKISRKMRESDQAYGRVEAFLQVAGYTMARAFADVEYLLDETLPHALIWGRVATVFLSAATF
jgi:hypothetical protein